MNAKVVCNTRQYCFDPRGSKQPKSHARMQYLAVLFWFDAEIRRHSKTSAISFCPDGLESKISMRNEAVRDIRPYDSA